MKRAEIMRLVLNDRSAYYIRLPYNVKRKQYF